MFENIVNFFKRLKKAEEKNVPSKDTAKERLHLVLMQDRANVSADFLELMKQEIIEVIKKYIDVEEEAIDVRLTNEIKEDGTTGAPSLYANIPIVNIKNEMKKEVEKEKIEKEKKEEDKKEEQKETKQEELKAEEQEKSKEEINEEVNKEKSEECEAKESEENKETESENNEEEKKVEEVEAEEKSDGDKTEPEKEDKAEEENK